jgi:hypothetical protein
MGVPENRRALNDAGYSSIAFAGSMADDTVLDMVSTKARLNAFLDMLGGKNLM